ncbi:uncharacterized protein LOC116852895 [Odontomachus brunneus]|uniref:uncharacterized protein LOC116852895 n=1 Tax=Odontomachus brunneus TaxID=486640 RepID=UPI0013F20F09|nr:uncharacterized protein LOC116852895 [Odontomachus brunneus]
MRDRSRRGQRHMIYIFRSGEAWDHMVGVVSGDAVPEDPVRTMQNWLKVRDLTDQGMSILWYFGSRFVLCSHVIYEYVLVALEFYMLFIKLLTFGGVVKLSN